MLHLLILGVLLIAPASTVRAERATERYAPLQLEEARQWLRRAREAQPADAALAGQFASQAGLDARLAWGMSDSAALRRQAAEVAAQSDALARRLSGRAEQSAAAQ